LLFYPTWLSFIDWKRPQRCLWVKEFELCNEPWHNGHAMDTGFRVDYHATTRRLGMEDDLNGDRGGVLSSMTPC